MSGCNNARKIESSKDAVNDFLRNPEDYVNKKRTGKPKSLSERRTLNLACEQKMSSAQSQEQLQLSCTS